MSRSFCQRNCFGQWVVRTIPVLITQKCTRTLQCTQVLLHALHNLECQTVVLLALWWEWRWWVYLIVPSLRFLLSVMTRWNFKPLDFPVGLALNVNQFQLHRYPKNKAGSKVLGLGWGGRAGSGMSCSWLPVKWLDFCESVFSSVKWDLKCLPHSISVGLNMYRTSTGLGTW